MATKVNASELNVTLANRLYDSLKEVDIIPLTTSVNISDIEKSGFDANIYVENVKKANAELETQNFAVLFAKVEKFAKTLQGAELDEYNKAKEKTNGFATTFKPHLGGVENTPTKATASGFRASFNSINLLRKKGSAMNNEISDERKEEIKKAFNISGMVAGLLKPVQWRQFHAQLKSMESK